MAVPQPVEVVLPKGLQADTAAAAGERDLVEPALRPDPGAASAAAAAGDVAACVDAAAPLVTDAGDGGMPIAASTALSTFLSPCCACATSSLTLPRLRLDVSDPNDHDMATDSSAAG